MAREPQTGGLNLPRDVGIPETETQSITQRWNTVKLIDARLEALGMHRNDEPDIECPPVTTEALVTTDIREYSTIFSAQLRWYNYVTRLVADVRAVILEVKNAMGDIERHKRKYFREMDEGKTKKDGKMTVQEMEDDIELDPAYRDLKLHAQQLEQTRIKLDAWGESLDRNLKTVSRQIENRKAEGLAGSREGNMPASASGRWERR
jgi:hypothetical protein